MFIFSTNKLGILYAKTVTKICLCSNGDITCIFQCRKGTNKEKENLEKLG